jgi:hypothetical protein
MKTPIRADPSVLAARLDQNGPKSRPFRIMQKEASKPIQQKSAMVVIPSASIWVLVARLKA